MHVSSKGFQEIIGKLLPNEKFQRMWLENWRMSRRHRDTESSEVDNHLLVRMCTYFNSEVWTLRKTFFLKDLEEGFSLFNLVFIDSFLLRYFQMNTHEDKYAV